MQAHDGRPFPLPPGASGLRGHEAARGRIRRLADTVGQREQRQEQLMFSRKLSTPRTNKNHVTRLPIFCYHVSYLATSIYIYMYAT